MRKALPALLLLFFWMTCPGRIAAQEASATPPATSLTPGATEPVTNPSAVAPGISSPAADSTLNGLVTIRGSAPAAWELAFGYRNDPTGTWFRLAASSEPREGDLLNDWDTTLLTDGLYTLRLRIFAADSAQDYLVNIRIRNYSPEDTPTPAGTPTPTPTASPTPLPSATPTITFTPAPLPTPLPPNPAQLHPPQIGLYFGAGALTVTAVFTFFGLLLVLSKKLRA
ncbi:MAG: hypothetical protein NZP74_06900 [Anaerolineales bacterium]|nr:hypothetical protein [Anaerolineales bacterium]MDW8277128.1 hypothetical protein [Anaerolineales bacterium]